MRNVQHQWHSPLPILERERRERGEREERERRERGEREERERRERETRTWAASPIPRATARAVRQIF